MREFTTKFRRKDRLIAAAPEMHKFIKKVLTALDNDIFYVSLRNEAEQILSYIDNWKMKP